MLRFRGVEWRLLLLNFDYRSWPALGWRSVSGLIKVQIVPRVLTFLHAWFCSVVGVRPLTLQMFLKEQ